jgi:hypothetical protein
MWPASAWPRSLRSRKPHPKREASFRRVVEYLFLDVVYADDEIPLLAGDSTFRPRRTRG